MNMHTSPTYADVFLPREQNRGIVYELLLVLVGTLLLALSAQVSVLLPGNPVPITGQTFAVLMIGALYGRQRAVATVLAYLAEGAAGLPVFASGTGGAAILVGPTSGYLIGFVFAAGVVGGLAEWGWDRRMWSTLLAMVIGNLIIYTLGLLWLTNLIGLPAALTNGLYPFVGGDIIKILLAMALLPVGWRLMDASQK